jgi:hypothetical protein
MGEGIGSDIGKTIDTDKEKGDRLDQPFSLLERDDAREGQTTQATTQETREQE